MMLVTKRVATNLPEIGDGNRGLALLRKTSASAIALALALPIMHPSIAYAQDVPAAAEGQAAQASTGATANVQDASAAETDAITVTGSRIERSGFSAPTPTTVVGVEDMAKQGAPNVAAVLNQVPSFLPNSTPSTTGLTADNAGANILNLRGVGGNRTLILVNGRRHVPTTATGNVDVNLIPQALIKRVEVVTGGASAAYGSDAVAGVVNFILDEKFDGIQGSAQTGIAEEGDNREYRIALAAGGSFADGRGHVSIAGELFDGNGILRQTDRDWGRDEWQVIVNPTPGAGQPVRITARNVHQATRSEGGLILTGPFAGMQFAPDGTLVPFRPGSASNGQYQIGGDGPNQGNDISLVSPLDRQTLSANASYELTDDIRASVEATFGRAHSTTQVTNTFSFAPYTIQQGNPFLPADVEAALAPGETFRLGRLNSDFGFYTTDQKIKSYRVVAALDGTLDDNWKWSAYYQYGKTHLRGIVRNSPIVANLNRAIDAVRAPNGDIVCRTTLTDPTNGCVPINLFGSGAPSAAALNYVLGEARTIRETRQDVFAAELKGDLFATWAGPVSVAVGAEYRKESALVDPDPVSRSGGFLLGNPQPLDGEFNVKEAFAETLIPLLADSPLGKSLDLNLAVRFTDYSLSGSVTTWKAGVSYALNDSLRFRATRSRDIRAPNLNELFLPNQLTFSNIVDPRDGSSAFIGINRQGSTALKPEKADTLTAGAIFEPTFIPGFHAAVDFYDIDLKGAISTLAPQDILDRCDAGATELCSLITRDASGTITALRLPFLNIASLKTRGVDIEASYRMPLERGGTLNTRVLATYVDKLAFSDGITTIDRAGDVGQLFNNGVPKWRVTANLGYEDDVFAATLTGLYIAAGKYDASFVEGVDIDDNHVSARFYLNGSLEFTVLDDGGKRVQLFGVVNNILDKDPPRAPDDFQNAYYSNPSLYDMIGRNFVAGVRFKF